MAQATARTADGQRRRDDDGLVFTRLDGDAIHDRLPTCVTRHASRRRRGVQRRRVRSVRHQQQPLAEMPERMRRHPAKWHHLDVKEVLRRHLLEQHHSEFLQATFRTPQRYLGPRFGLGLPEHARRPTGLAVTEREDLDRLEVHRHEPLGTDTARIDPVDYVRVKLGVLLARSLSRVAINGSCTSSTNAPSKAGRLQPVVV